MTVTGELDAFTAPTLTAALNGLIDLGHWSIVVDLSAVTLVDASGAKAIAEAGERARNAGHTVTVRAPSALTREVLDVTGAARHVVLTGQDAARDITPSGGRTSSRATMPSSAIDLVDASLEVITSLADATVAHSAGVSITLERYGRPITVAASTDRVLAVDQHQYETGQGPCLDAKTYDEWFHIESLATETRWPEFVPLALEHGIRSILSSPLKTHARAQGSLNLYATVEQAFGPREQQLAALFADKASNILTTADEDVTDQRWNRRFATALNARRTIHQAQGIIMAREDIAAEDALARLMQAARTRAMTAFAYASEIVNSLPEPGHTEHERTSP